MIRNEKILENKEKIEKEIKNIKMDLKHFPKRNIYAVRNGKYTKWYMTDGHEAKLIPSKEKDLIEKLTLKKYYQDKLCKLELQNQAIDNYLKQLQNYSNKHPDMFDANSPYSPILIQHHNNYDDFTHQWLAQTYESPIDKYNNHDKTTVLKENVISKSEQQIANLLWSNNIPYKYECPLKLGYKTVHPDFTILHPRTHEIYYWEHLGMMDLKSYYINSCNKLKDYCDNGYYPGDHLIITFETSEKAINSSEIQHIIEHYFLDK